MNALVIGTPEDVAGFALAGVDGVVCETAGEAAQAISRANEDTLVLVSAKFARHDEPRRLLVVLPARS
jgi:vacuolar-type H+-ATPase subunit F/Vma7